MFEVKHINGTIFNAHKLFILAIQTTILEVLHFFPLRASSSSFGIFIIIVFQEQLISGDVCCAPVHLVDSSCLPLMNHGIL